MAFVCTVTGDSVDVEVFQRGNAYGAVINVGYEDSSDIGYSVVIGFEPMAGGDLEFYFHLVEFGDGQEEVIYWSGKDIPDSIQESDRACILDAILGATGELLSQIKPQRFTYCTHDQNAPEKALLKHFLMMNVFKQCGYAVQVADSYHGKRVWWMELPAG